MAAERRRQSPGPPCSTRTATTCHSLIRQLAPKQQGGDLKNLRLPRSELLQLTAEMPRDTRSPDARGSCGRSSATCSRWSGADGAQRAAAAARPRCPTRRPRTRGRRSTSSDRPSATSAASESPAGSRPGRCDPAGRGADREDARRLRARTVPPTTHQVGELAKRGQFAMCHGLWQRADPRRPGRCSGRS